MMQSSLSDNLSFMWSDRRAFGCCFSGFTLIEMLVVVALISLLASLVLTRIAEVRQLARDQRHLQDMQEIQKAIEMYISEHGKAPWGVPPNQLLRESSLVELVWT